VFAVDSVPARLAAAAAAGAIPLNLDEGDVEVRVRALAARGCDAVMECVGAAPALHLAFTLLRPGGILSSVGVHTAPALPFPPGAAYDKNLTLRMGRCPARSLMPASVALLGRLKARGVDVAGAVVSHRLTLEEGVHAYDLFSGRREGCTKVVLDCGCGWLGPT
jgi:threonine dehydrogenase-like Zn-dependent dehydrogenase